MTGPKVRVVFVHGASGHRAGPVQLMGWDDVLDFALLPPVVPATGYNFHFAWSESNTLVVTYTPFVPRVDTPHD